MRETCSLVWSALVGLLRSRASLEAEILVLRHQLNVQRRKSPKRLAFSTMDRLIFAGLYRMVPSVLNALTIVKPETVIKWHRAGFRLYWRWKSRPHGGLRALALFGRRPPQRVDSLVMPASENLHTSGLMHCSKEQCIHVPAEKVSTRPIADGSVELSVTDRTQPICSNVAKWLAQSRTPS